MSKAADSTRRGLMEAVAYAEGKADESACLLVIARPRRSKRLCKPCEACRPF